MLVAAVGGEPAPRPGERAAEVCAGTGLAATTAAGRGYETIAVDVTRRAVANSVLTARLNGVVVRGLRGSIDDVVMQPVDLLLANPPYVSTLGAEHGDRTVDGGRDGRLLVDVLCRRAPSLLRPGGRLLLVQSAVTGTEATLAALQSNGLQASVVDSAVIPFGPVMTHRAEALTAAGLIAPGQRFEELVLVRAIAPSSPTGSRNDEWPSSQAPSR